MPPLFFYNLYASNWVHFAEETLSELCKCQWKRKTKLQVRGVEVYRTWQDNSASFTSLSISNWHIQSNVLLVESIAQKRCSLTYVSVGVSVKPNWYVQLKLNLLRMQRNYIGHSKTTWQVWLRCRSRIRIHRAQYSEWTVGPLNSATCPPIFMQLTGCHQPVQRFYWPENAIDWLREC